MNRFFKFISVLSALAVLFGCSDSGKELDKVQRQITLSQNLVFVGGEGKDNVEIIVNSEKDWTASPVVLGEETLDWVTLSQTEGPAGETKITLTVAAAAAGESPRSAAFHFVIDEKHSDILTVRQESFAISGVRMMGAAAAADKPLDKTLNVAYNGVVEPFEAKVTVSLAQNLISLEATEFTAQFGKGAGVVEIPLTGMGLKTGDETMTVKIEGVEEEFKINFHVGGYVKIKDIIADIYPKVPADGSRPDGIVYIVKEDLLIKGIVISSNTLEGKARPTAPNELVIQDSTDPNSALWLKTEGTANHGMAIGTEVEVNLKGFNLSYGATFRRQAKNQGGTTNAASLRKIADPDMSKLEAMLTVLTKEEFLQKGDQYQEMYVQIDDVDIKPGEVGKTFKPQPNGNFGFVELINPVEGSTNLFMLSSFKGSPWVVSKEKVEKTHIAHLKGFAALNIEPDPAHPGQKVHKYCIYPQSREDFVME